MSKADTWLPLFVGDYLGATMHLTTTEHGAYLLLLMHEWRAGPLPDDDARLATIARTDAATWQAMAATIRAFFRLEGGRLVQPRLERERARATENVAQRSAAGKASAAKRAAQREGNARSTDVGSPLEQNARPSPSPISEIPTVSPPAPRAVQPPPDARAELWLEGLTRLRRLTGKGDRAARAMLGRFVAEAGDDCALVSSLLHEAERDRMGDPVAWITAAIATRTGRRRGAGPPSRLSWMLGDPPAPAGPSFDFDSSCEEAVS